MTYHMCCINKVPHIYVLWMKEFEKLDCSSGGGEGRERREMQKVVHFLMDLFMESLYQLSDSNMAETTISNPLLGGTHCDLQTE